SLTKGNHGNVGYWCGLKARIISGGKYVRSWWKLTLEVWPRLPSRWRGGHGGPEHAQPVLIRLTCGSRGPSTSRLGRAQATFQDRNRRHCAAGYGEALVRRVSRAYMPFTVGVVGARAGSPMLVSLGAGTALLTTA